MKTLLVMLLFVNLQIHAEWNLEVRTHNGKNPFGDTVRIVDEGGKSWRDAEYAPIFHIISEMSQNSDEKRWGTGFVVGRYTRDGSSGLLVLTDYHVLSERPALDYNGRAIGEKVAVKIFKKKGRESLPGSYPAKVIGVSEFSDLMLLEVPLAPEILKGFILPKLAVLEPKYFESKTWSPWVFNIPPSEDVTKYLSYTFEQAPKRSVMTNSDVVNPYAPGVEKFWYLSGGYIPGMSGGPLVGHMVQDQDEAGGGSVKPDKLEKELEDVFFGALGFILDPSAKNGYAYPLSGHFVRLLQLAKDRNLRDREETSLGGPKNRLVIKTEESHVYTYQNNSPNKEFTIFGPSARVEVSKKIANPRVQDEVKVIISGCREEIIFGEDGKAKESCPKEIELQLTQKLVWVNSNAKSGQVGSGAGQGTLGSGGSGQGSLGSGGAGHGTVGGGEGQGTVGGGHNSASTIGAQYKIEFSALENLRVVSGSSSYMNSSYLVYPMSLNKYRSEEVDRTLPLRHLKELLYTLSMYQMVSLKLSDNYYDFEMLDKYRKNLEEPLIPNDLNIEGIGQLFAESIGSAEDLRADAIVSGRFVGNIEGSKIISGRINIAYGGEDVPDKPTLSWGFSILKVKESVVLRASNFTFKGKKLELKNPESFGVWIEQKLGRTRISITNNGQYLGAVWP